MRYRFPSRSPRFNGLISGENGENVDQNTDYVTRVEILQPDSTGNFLVRMWGSCQPEDCFWGDNAGADIIGGQSNPGSPGLALEWEFESWAFEQQVRLVEKDLLQIETHMQHLDTDIEFDVTDRLIRTREPETDTSQHPGEGA